MSAAHDTLTAERTRGAVTVAALAHGWTFIDLAKANPTQSWLPDLLLLRGSEMLAVKVLSWAASRKGRPGLSEKQEATLASFEAAGAEAHVWSGRTFAEMIDRLGQLEDGPQ